MEQLSLSLVFDSTPLTSAKQLQLRIINSQWIDEWIAERHYLEYSPCGARLRLAVYHDGQCVGGMLWGRPTARAYGQF